MIKRLIFLGVFCSLGLFSANAQLSLKDAIDKAQSNNKGNKAANLSLEAKQSATKSAWGRWYPEISATAAYTHLNDDLVLDLDPIRSVIISLQAQNSATLSKMSGGTVTYDQAYAALNQKIPSFKETLKEQNFPQMIVNLKQPIFTGGKITAGIKAAEAQENVAQEKVKQAKENVSIEVIQRYLGVILAQENVKVRKDAYETIKQHQARANRLMEEGVIASTDKLRADVALSESSRNLYEAEERLKLAKIALQSILGISEPIEVKDEMKSVFTDILSEDAAKNARENNTNLLQLREATKAYNAKSNAEYASFFPTVFGYGFYNVFDHYIIPESEPKWGIGIGASFELFNGFRHERDYETATKEAEAIIANTEETERKIDLLSRSQSLEISLAQNRYTQLNADLSQAEENVRLNEKRFEAGLGTSLESIDANLALESIKLQRVKALNDYYLNLASLCQTMGNVDKFVQVWSK